MADRRTPIDKVAVSDEQRAMWEAEIRLGREPYITPVKSRSKIGRLLDFLDSASRGSRHSIR